MAENDCLKKLPCFFRNKKINLYLAINAPLLDQEQTEKHNIFLRLKLKVG